MNAVLQDLNWDRALDDAPDCVATIQDDQFERMWSFVPQLRGHLQRQLSAADTDDVIQDVFLRLLQCVPRPRVEFPKRYLYQVANAVLIDRRRRAMSRCAFLHCELTDDHHPTDSLSPLRILLAREQVQTLQIILKDMPPRTREIIVAIRLEGSSLKSLAAHYKISASAIEKHISRALRALSEGLVVDTPTVKSPARKGRSDHSNQQRSRLWATQVSSPANRPEIHSQIHFV